MIRRIAFLGGLVLGSGLCAWALGSALIYLFTGKIPSVQFGRARGLNVDLIDAYALYEAPATVVEPDIQPGGEGI
jgi:hypothetical protein